MEGARERRPRPQRGISPKETGTPPVGVSKDASLASFRVTTTEMQIIDAVTLAKGFPNRSALLREATWTYVNGVVEELGTEAILDAAKAAEKSRAEAQINKIDALKTLFNTQSSPEEK